MPRRTSRTSAPTASHRVGDGVHEAQLGGQKGVGGVLDRLGGGGVGHDERGLRRREQPTHPGGGGPVVRNSTYDAVGVQGVVDGRPFAQELGVRHHGHVRTLEDLLDQDRRPHRDRRLVDYDSSAHEVWADLLGDRLEEVHVGGTVGALWGRHAQEDEGGLAHGVGRAQHEAQPPRLEPDAQKVCEPLFHDGGLAPRQAVHLVGIRLPARHPVAEVRQDDRRREAHVAGSDDRCRDRCVVGPGAHGPTGARKAPSPFEEAVGAPHSAAPMRRPRASRHAGIAGMPDRRATALSSTELAGRGAGRGGRESAVAIGCTQAGIMPGGLEYRLGKPEPRGGPGVGGDVERPGRTIGGQHRQDTRQIGGERGACPA